MKKIITFALSCLIAAGCANGSVEVDKICSTRTFPKIPGNLPLAGIPITIGTEEDLSEAFDKIDEFGEVSINSLSVVLTSVEKTDLSFINEIRLFTVNQDNNEELLGESFVVEGASVVLPISNLSDNLKNQLKSGPIKFKLKGTINSLTKELTPVLSTCVSAKADVKGNLFDALEVGK